MRGILSKLRLIWSALGILLLILIALELFWNFAYFVKHEVLKQSFDTRVNADCYAGDRSSASAYWKEFYALVYRWQPFVYWRLKTTKTPYISIESNGLRHTWNPPGLEHDPSATIYVFGGSTSWGLGVRDDDTIPSLLSKILNQESHVAVRVINFGQLGYVNTQEFIALLLELQHHRTPDLVIFYDGVNDITSAILNKTGGETIFEQARAREFNILEKSRRKELLKAFLSSNLANLTTTQLLSHARLLRGSNPRSESGPEIEKLSTAVVDHYVSNLLMIHQLGKLRGFQTLFYWQPLLLTKKHRSPYEEKEMADLTHLGLTSAVYRNIGNSNNLRALSGFRNLSHIFDDVSRPIYVDYCHVSAAGNKMIAKQMAADVLKALRGHSVGSVPRSEKPAGT